MKRKLWFGASFGALVLAAMAPWSASQANGVSIRVNTPEFGIRIGAPHFPRAAYQPAPVYQPVPVHYPRLYGYAPPPVVYTPPPRYFAPPHFVGGYRGRDHHRNHWQNRHWQPHWNHRYDQHRDR
jgi:hypothetical protein